jgi:hypothetical protein
VLQYCAMSIRTAQRSFLFFCVLFFACKAPKHHASLLEMGPQNTPWAAWTPNLEVFFSSLDGFLQKTVTPLSPRQVSLMRAELKEQWGLDPFVASDWAAFGIAAKSGFLVFAEPSTSQPVWVVEAADMALLEKSFKKIATQVRSAGSFKTSSLHKHTLFTAYVPFGEEEVPVAYMMQVGAYAFFAGGEGEKALTAIAQRYNTRGIPLEKNTTLEQSAERRAAAMHVEPGMVYAYGHTSHTAQPFTYMASHQSDAKGFQIHYWTNRNTPPSVNEAFQQAVQPYKHPKPLVSVLSHNTLFKETPGFFIDPVDEILKTLHMFDHKEVFTHLTPSFKNGFLAEWYPLPSSKPVNTKRLDAVLANTGFHVVASTSNIPNAPTFLETFFKNTPSKPGFSTTSYNIQKGSSKIKAYILSNAQNSLHTSVYKDFWIITSSKEILQQWIEHLSTTPKAGTPTISQNPAYFQCTVYTDTFATFSDMLYAHTQQTLFKKTAQFLRILDNLVLTGSCTPEKGCSLQLKEKFK